MNAFAKNLIIQFARLIMALFLLAFFLPAKVQFEQAAAEDVVPPVVSAMDPAIGINDMPTPVTIIGSGFLQDLTDPLNPVQPSATLGTIALSDVTWVDEATLTATVPWGMDPGTYDLTVTNPDGGSAGLAGAFTVQNGVGLWTGGDIYGGAGQQVRLKPGDPGTIYVLAYGVGIFRSQDAAEHWSLITGNVTGNADFGLDPLHPSNIFLFSPQGIYRSQDEGDTWSKWLDHWADGRPMNDMPHAYPSPHDSQVIFVSSAPHLDVNNGGAQGLIRSTDGGATWQIVSQMEGIPVTSVAFHPTDTSQMVLGTQDGRVFQSMDEGATWSEVTRSTATDIGLITYNPYRPDEVWVSNGWMHSSETGELYKSTAPDFTAWQDVMPKFWGGNPGPQWFLEFTGPDSVYTVHAHTTNGGTDWYSIGSWNGYGEIRFDPGNSQIGYIGDVTYGVQKTADSGQTWQVKNQGFTAMVAHQIGASLFNPQRIYATFEGWPGIFRSEDGAQNWKFFQIDGSFNVRWAREDPLDPQRLYAAADAGLYVSTDGGQTFVAKGWNMPPPFHTCPINAFVLDPFQPGHMLAGFQTGSDPSHTKLYGQLYASTDYGESWQPIAFMPGDQDDIVDIQFHPETPGLVYLSSLATGIYRSTDGGSTWARIDDQNQSWMQTPRNITIATQPQNTLVVWTPSGPFRSLDDGDTWHSGQPAFLASIYMFLDANSSQLYGGGYGGLYFSPNVGDSWKRAAGSLGTLKITALGSGAGKDYTILYAATTGGSATASSGRSSGSGLDAFAKPQVPVNAGIYRYVKQPSVGKAGVPVLLAPKNNALTTDPQPSLDWKDAQNADHYQLEVSSSRDFAALALNRPDLKKSDYTFTEDLANNTRYYWRVRAYNAIGKPGAWSSVRSFRVALPAPISLQEENSIQNLRPELSWKMPGGYAGPSATSYTLQIARDLNFKQLVKTLSLKGAATTAVTLPFDLPRNQSTLYWRVSANGLNGPSDWTAAPDPFSTGNPPSIPRLLSPANKARVTSLNPLLDWSDSSGGPLPLTYWVEYATNPGFTGTASFASSASQSNFPGDLASASTYYWHVRACNSNTECSDWSSVRSFKTP